MIFHPRAVCVLVAEIRALHVQKGYALADVLGLVFERVTKFEMPNKSKVLLYETMAEIEYVRLPCTRWRGFLFVHTCLT